MSTFGFAVLVGGALLIYWALGGGKLAILGGGAPRVATLPDGTTIPLDGMDTGSFQDSLNAYLRDHPGAVPVVFGPSKEQLGAP